MQTKARGRPSTKPKHLKKLDLATAKPPIQRSNSHKPPRHSSYASSVERDYVHEPTRHSSFRYSQDQEHPTPSTLRNYDDFSGYNSAYVNCETPGEPGPFMNQDTFRNYDDYPGYNSAYVNYRVPSEPTPFMNQDAVGESYFSNPSTAINDLFRFNENTVEFHVQRNMISWG